ncbi:hypothetical protein C8R45DRAFT_151852 [Mycena sanguinolenta]|nr:hypothetical protein C8R45DRAFT_151852 [Mycena sanguinolenta]
MRRMPRSPPAGNHLSSCSRNVTSRAAPRLSLIAPSRYHCASPTNCSPPPRIRPCADHCTVYDPGRKGGARDAESEARDRREWRQIRSSLPGAIPTDVIRVVLRHGSFVAQMHNSSWTRLMFFRQRGRIHAYLVPRANSSCLQESVWGASCSCPVLKIVNAPDKRCRNAINLRSHRVPIPELVHALSMAFLAPNTDKDPGRMPSCRPRHDAYRRRMNIWIWSQQH